MKSGGGGSGQGSPKPRSESKDSLSDSMNGANGKFNVKATLVKKSTNSVNKKTSSSRVKDSSK